MKRKSTEDAGSSSQRSKTSRGESSSHHDMTLCDRPWPLKAGMIEEVNLKNFMCHEKFQFVPNMRLNFLVGVNGSGKSAVLTAIVFALGGSARTANRGTSNKTFIRTGQTSATVEVKLCNVGAYEYKEHIYGKSITVSRTVTETSSSYKLKDESGKVVATKRVREELQKILNQFNIQIENPMIVLNQDTSKTFLSNQDPELMYKFFHRSTQLKKVEEDYDSAETVLRNSKHALFRKEDSMPTIAEEVTRWARQLEILDSISGEQQEMTDMQSELVWAMVRDNEKTLSDREKNKAAEMAKTEACQEFIDKIKNKDKEMRARKIAIEKEIQGIASQIVEINAEVEKMNKTLHEKMRHNADTNRQVKEIDHKMKRANRNLKDVQNALIEARSKADMYEETCRIKQAEIEQLEAEVNALAAQIESSNNHLFHLKNNCKEVEKEFSQMRYRDNGVNEKINGVQKEIRELESGEKNKLASFGPHMLRILAEIERNKRRFTKMPIGPLGAHIKVNEGVPDSVVTILEGELGNIISAFVVDTNADQIVLFDIFNKLNVTNKPLIITSEFSDRNYNIENARVRSKFTTLIDCIHTTDATVFNTVVDNAQLEKVIVIDDMNKAQEILSNVETVPANLKMAVVAGKYQYYPAPNYKSYFRQYRPRNILKASFDDYIKERKETLEGLMEQKREIKAEMTENQAKMNETSKLLRQEEHKINVVRRQKTEKENRIAKTRNELFSVKPVDVAALEDDEAKFTHEIQDLETKKDSILEKGKAEIAEEQELKSQIEVKEKTSEGKRLEVEPLKAELTRKEEGIKKNKREIDHYTLKKAEHNNKANSFNNAIDEARKELEKNRKTAVEMHETRIETVKETAKLKQELLVLKSKLDKIKGSVEPREIVSANYNKFARAFREAEFELKVLSNMIHDMNVSIERRKQNYMMMLRSTSQTVQRNFTLQLQTRGFLGILEFNHKKFTLDIKVNPHDRGMGGLDVDRSLKTLSGGEKSFTSISLILSLWNVMYPPFRILDEFDVFMDAVNRKIAIQNIVNFAKTDRKNQFIFLTPLSTDNIAVDDDLKIIQLQKLR